MKNAFKNISLMIVILAGGMTSVSIPAHAVNEGIDPEAIRAQIIAVIQNQQVLAGKIGDTASLSALAKAEQQMNAATPEELFLMKNVDYSSLNEAIINVNTEVDQTLANATNPPYQTADSMVGLPGLSNAAYSATCGATSRSDDAASVASNAALIVAEGVRDAASRACNEVVVVLGEGGNGSLVCLATDVVYIAAKSTNSALIACDGSVDSTEILGTYNRTKDIYDTIIHNHTDLMTELAAVQLNGTDLATHDTDIKTRLTTQDVVQAAHNAALATHDGDIKAVMGAQSAALSTHDGDIKATLASLGRSMASHDRALAIRMNKLDAVLALLHPQVSAPSVPQSTISLSLNSTTFTTGSTINLTTTAQASVPPANADTYLALLLPNHELLIRQPDGSFGTALVPYQANVQIPTTPSGVSLSYTFTGNEQPGTYTLFSAHMLSGTLNMIGPLAQTSFNFTP